MWVIFGTKGRDERLWTYVTRTRPGALNPKVVHGVRSGHYPQRPCYGRCTGLRRPSRPQRLWVPRRSDPSDPRTTPGPITSRPSVSTPGGSTPPTPEKCSWAQRVLSESTDLKEWTSPRSGRRTPKGPSTHPAPSTAVPLPPGSSDPPGPRNPARETPRADHKTGSVHHVSVPPTIPGGTLFHYQSVTDPVPNTSRGRRESEEVVETRVGTTHGRGLQGLLGPKEGPHTRTNGMGGIVPWVTVGGLGTVTETMAEPQTRPQRVFETPSFSHPTLESLLVLSRPRSLVLDSAPQPLTQGRCRGPFPPPEG